MGVHVVGDGVHVHLEDIVGRKLSDALVGALVSVLERLRGLGPRLARQHEPQRVTFDVLTPDFVDLVVGHRPRQLAAVPLERLDERVIGLRRQQPHRVLDALAGAPAEQVENVEHGLQIARSGAIIELVAQAIEARDVACGEIHSIRRRPVVLIAGCFASICRGGSGSTAASTAKLVDAARREILNRPKSSFTLAPWSPWPCRTNVC